MESIYGKNKLYLSYSAIDLWYKNREQYIKRYFEATPVPDTRYTAFGRKVHEMIAKDPSLSHIPRLAHFEAKLRVNMQGIELLSFIDTYNPSSCQFFEYKSGIVKPNGCDRWTEEDVKKHKQLPFYAMMIKTINGFFNPDTLLIFLETCSKKDETKNKNCSIIWNDKMQLTGKHKIFARTIEKEEVDSIVDWTKVAAEEIKTEYQKWLRK